MEAIKLRKQSLRAVRWGPIKGVFEWTRYIETFFIRIWISKEKPLKTHTTGQKQASFNTSERRRAYTNIPTWQLRWRSKQH